MNEILLIGGGGHCLSVLDAIEKAGEFKIIGVIDKKEKKGEKIGSYKIVGNDEDLAFFFDKGIKFAFITLGSIENPSLRQKLQELCEKIGFIFPIIIDPSAVLAKNVDIKEGCFIGKATVINREVTLGKGAIINTGSIIEHNSIIGEFTHIAPGSIVAGNVTIGSCTHIGAGTTIIQQINIGGHSLIGAASNVVKDIPGYSRGYGNPYREVRNL